MANIPDELPEWATDDNYAAGTDPWSGTATKIEPSAGVIAKGQIPQTGFSSQVYNWLLNKSGQHHVLLKEILYRNGVYISHEFSHGTTPDNSWDLSGAATETLVEDTGSYGGSLDLDSTGVADSSIEQKYNMRIGTSEFWFSARSRYVSAKAGIYRIGLWSGTAGQRIYFQYDTGSVNWKVVENSNTTTTSTATAVTYQVLDIFRLDGTVYFAVNGTVVHSNANTVNLSDIAIRVANDTTGGTEPRNRVDYIKFICPERIA